VLLILIGVIFLSSLGDEIAMVAFLFKMERASSSGFSLSILLAAQIVPGILLSPFTGQMIDRLETTRVLARQFPRKKVLEAVKSQKKI